MSYETLLTEARDGVAVVTVNRSDVRNALNRRVIESVRSTLDRFREDDGVVTLIFTGAGEKAFVAGTHIGELKDRTIVDGLAANMLRLYDEIEGFEKPTIATVNGYAFGGGCELAIACDIRLASENARFGLSETSLWIIPAAGGTQRLARLVGKGRALEMILTGRTIGAEEALNIGLVSRVVPQAELMDAA
jgi:enoyl-CoA hydratase/carnithine racemase